MLSTSGASTDQLTSADADQQVEDFSEFEEEAPFLWEQISASIDPVELHEVQRVVGTSLINGLTDIYSEIRALREIHRDYSAGTDELVRKCNSLPRSTGSQPAGLVQLELKSLVGQLRKRAAANGVDAEALLPVPSSPQRKALESVLRETEGAGGDPLPPERSRTAYLGARPGTADSERLSLREMRLGGSANASRPGLVVSRLRAALEEEKQALLAQSEALRLSIEDEHDYRGRVAQPPPSLTSLLELKRSLQDILAKTPDHDHLHAACMHVQPAAPGAGADAHAPAGTAGMQAHTVQIQDQARGRSNLSQHAPLPAIEAGAVQGQ